MFYEDDRIVRKQAKWVNMKAYEMISNFESKGLKRAETAAALDLLLKDENGTESHKDIVSRALIILDYKDSDEEQIK